MMSTGKMSRVKSRETEMRRIGSAPVQRWCSTKRAQGYPQSSVRAPPSRRPPWAPHRPPRLPWDRRVHTTAAAAQGRLAAPLQVQHVADVAGLRLQHLDERRLLLLHRLELLGESSSMRGSRSEFFSVEAVPWRSRLTQYAPLARTHSRQRILPMTEYRACNDPATRGVEVDWS